MPQTADERGRADRRANVCLVADRVVRLQTRTRREMLLAAFNEWLVSHAFSGLDVLLGAREVDADYIAELLVCYGKELYYARKPYRRYSETINAVAARRPAIRQSLVAAWDLAFCWVTHEPGQHHPAMPLAVVLAFSALALGRKKLPFCSSPGVEFCVLGKCCKRSDQTLCCLSTLHQESTTHFDMPA